MTYQHTWIDGSAIDLPVGKAVCVGRNYAAHARELGNEVPDSPILFIKPASALAPFNQHMVIPRDQGEVHHEIEIAVLVNERLQHATAKEVQYNLAGYALALDLTLRDVQNQLKEKGQPWERAKAFDHACPVSGFVDARGVSVRQALELSLTVNGDIRQQGSTAQMLFPIFDLVAHISAVFTLEPGDMVLTGTPAGVAPLQPGDILEARMGNLLTVSGAIA